MSVFLPWLLSAIVLTICFASQSARGIPAYRSSSPKLMAFLSTGIPAQRIPGRWYAMGYAYEHDTVSP
ncbi:hypothetical protein IG631_23591 [Alternaria alternata]|nr:hypothetical protein IG631_23591 [Alternaria alternata]